MSKRSNEQIIPVVVQSDAFKVEAACVARSGLQVCHSARLFKHLENDLVRIIFPTTARDIDEGTAVGLVCLYDQKESRCVYAHVIFAGPTSNASLRSIYNP